MSWSNGDEKVVVKWNGAFRISDDEKDISWMEDGATLSIADGVARAFADQMGGTLRWHSALGKGTSVILDLPV